MLLSDAKNLVRHAFEAGRLAHAFMLVGSPKGVAGELAVYMARMLACEARVDGEPCTQCETCRKIAEHTWCDGLWIAPMKKSRVISVDQMRRGSGDNKVPPPYLLSWLAETSFAGGWKVAVISGADRLNETAANAFLKTLEEPPPQTLLLLLTDSPQALLPTIRSRCQRLDLNEPPRELSEPWRDVVLSVLVNSEYSGPLAATAMSGRIQAVLGEIQAHVEKDVAEEIHSEGGIDVESDEQEARVSSRYREERALLILMLQRWFRDLMILRAGGDISEVHYKSCAETLEARAKKITLAQALANVDAIDGLSRQLERSIPDSTAFPYWLDRMTTGV